MLGAIDDLDDAAVYFLARSLDADQRAIADAACLAGSGPAWCRNMDDRSLAMGLFVPFGGPRQKLAIAVAAGDVGKLRPAAECRRDAAVCAAGRCDLRRPIPGACD